MADPVTVSRAAALVVPLDRALEAAVGPKLGRLAELAELAGMAGLAGGEEAAGSAGPAAAGISVPSGFAVTVAGFRRQADHLGLAGLAPEAARARLLTEAVEPDLAAAITAAYEELCEQRLDLGLPVAVRSSAVGEDGATASFAGVFDTFLGMSGSGRVLDAVRRCWASLFGSRALAYREGVEPDGREMPTAMAVGVLELVPARASGVAFSVHPVTGARDRVVIEANFGCGEAVVQGLVTPDHIQVGLDGRVIDLAVNRKDVISVFDYVAGEVTLRPMPLRLRTRPVLDAEQLAAVARAVRAVASHYGHPVDVEWAISRHRRPGDPVTVLQARPVTVLNEAAQVETAAYPSAQVEPGEPELVWDPVAFAAKYVFGQQDADEGTS